MGRTADGQSFTQRGRAVIGSKGAQRCEEIGSFGGTFIEQFQRQSSYHQADVGINKRLDDQGCAIVVLSG